MTDLRIQHFQTLAGIPAGTKLGKRALDQHWRALRERVARGTLSEAKLERARGGYDLLRERARRPRRRARAVETPDQVLVRSRVQEARSGRFLPVALLPDLTVWSSATDFAKRKRAVVRAVRAGRTWQGRGPAELAALVDEIGRRLTPSVGLVAREMGPWLDLYIAYETHSITLRAIREHFRRTAHPDLDLLYKTIARCDGRRDLEREEVLQCTRFEWRDDITEGQLVGDDDHWTVPVSRRWRQDVHAQGLAMVERCLVVAIDEDGPLLIRSAGDDRYVIAR